MKVEQVVTTTKQVFRLDCRSKNKIFVEAQKQQIPDSCGTTRRRNNE